MDQFRRLMQTALIAGSISGFLLFAIQHFTVRPLIETAETYEHAADAAQPADHEDEGWQPEGYARTGLTALSTTLTGIGFAAILFGAVSLTDESLNARQGLFWGIACFGAFTLAPAIGLPPAPPGTGVADVTSRQIWWVATAIATTTGIWMIFREKQRMIRCLGVLMIIVPHLIGAPIATDPTIVPADLVRRFALVSIATDGMFWLTLGILGGFLHSRSDR
jgi:cobalt transporter subunit CbtA